jgi:hypothetical protein
MSKIEQVHASEDYKLLIDFNDGSKISFNMEKMVKTLAYLPLKDLSNFQNVRFDEKSVYWVVRDNKPEYFPLRLSLDNILFSLRD